jgi:hypothetical protein
VIQKFNMFDGTFHLNFRIPACLTCRHPRGTTRGRRHFASGYTEDASTRVAQRLLMEFKAHAEQKSFAPTGAL